VTTFKKPVLKKSRMTVNLTSAQFEELLSRIGSNAKKGSFASCHSEYDGTRNPEFVEAFITAITVYKKIECIPDDEAIAALPLLLKGEAAVWWNGIKSYVSTWDEFTSRLRHAFAPARPAYMIYQDIMQIKQDVATRTENFITQKRMLFAQLPSAHTETQQLDMIFGQLNIAIKEKVPRSSIKTFDGLLKAAREVEQLLQVVKEDKKTDANNRHVSAYTDTPDISKAFGQRNKNRVKCNFCHFTGHATKDCRKLKRKAAESTETSEQIPPNKEIQMPSPSTAKFSCYGCGTPGVVRTNCPSCSASKQRPTEAAGISFCSINVRSDIRNRPVVFISIGDTQGIAYVDTCAKTSVASYTLYQQLLRKGYQFHREPAYVTLADGISKRQEVLRTRVVVSLENRHIPTTFIVLPESRDNRTLLGIGFIQDAQMILNLPQFTWQFVGNNESYELFDEDYATFPTCDKPAEMVIELQRAALPLEGSRCDTAFPRSTKDVQIASYKLIPLHVSPSKKPLFDGYSPRFADYMMEDARTNTTEVPVALSPHSQGLFNEPNIHINSIKIEMDDTVLDSDQQKEIELLLQNYEDVFKSNGEPSLLGEHRIETTTEEPISVPPYRLVPNRREILKKEINKMLDEKIIEPCSSPWAAPVVLVPKPNGDIRVCIDYRRLNTITIPDAYPIPRLDDLLHAAKPTPFMTSLDLKAGYWQIRIRKEDEDKTAFITPFGIFKFKRMPFGLRNAPATFQRLVDRFRVSLEHVKILAYLDDILILSSSFEMHVKDLKDVLQKIREYNLVLNLEKCRFCRKTIKYLGHIITPDGLQTDPEKSKAIVDIPTPKDLKHLLSFIQMCSWYRRFIENFSAVAEPLTRLTRKNVKWVWNTEQEQAFQELKRRLITAPLLRPADETLPYTLKTDASAYALGAVLVQGEGPDEHPVEYASRLLIPAERNYSTTEREALAVIWALIKFRGYIEGLPVTVITDHQALKWLMNLKSPTGRLARWALMLQAYDVTIKYQPGKLNVVADALSRPTSEEETQACEVCNISIDMPTRSLKEVREEQFKDAHLRQIIESLEETNSGENAGYWSSKGNFMSNGLLYRLHPDTEGEDAQLLVPEKEWANILKAYHDDPLAGHYGADKTFRKITQRYYWKGIRKYIESYVKNCIDCQRFKPSNKKPAGLLQTTSMNQRFETVAFDLFGPLPTTEDGKNWIFIVEDVATRWVELFALDVASAENCAMTLVNEIFLRYGVPRRLTSDNGTQFVSAVMQQVTYCLKIKHNFTPLYHPEANPVERKNRDLKTQLAIIVQDSKNWAELLAPIRFALNTTCCSSTDYTPAYLTFGRELRSPRDNEVDFRQIMISENIVHEITPKLKRLSEHLLKAREVQELKEEQRKVLVDQSRRPQSNYKPGDLVLVESHPISKASQGVTAKFAPRRDGPYQIVRSHGPTSFQLSSPETPTLPIGVYHSSALTPFHKDEVSIIPQAVQPIRKRGRPKKITASRGRGRPRKH
jgi:hypothetical protein